MYGFADYYDPYGDSSLPLTPAQLAEKRAIEERRVIAERDRQASAYLLRRIAEQKADEERRQEQAQFPSLAESGHSSFWRQPSPRPGLQRSEQQALFGPRPAIADMQPELSQATSGRRQQDKPLKEFANASYQQQGAEMMPAIHQQIQASLNPMVSLNALQDANRRTMDAIADENESRVRQAREARMLAAQQQMMQQSIAARNQADRASIIRALIEKRSRPGYYNSRDEELLRKFLG